MVEKNPRRLRLGSQPELTDQGDTTPVAYSPSTPTEDSWPELRRPGITIQRTVRRDP